MLKSEQLTYGSWALEYELRLEESDEFFGLTKVQQVLILDDQFSQSFCPSDRTSSSQKVLQAPLHIAIHRFLPTFKWNDGFTLKSISNDQALKLEPQYI